MSMEQKKEINWFDWLNKCSKCGSTELETTDIHRLKWIKKNGTWELKEQKKIICKMCGDEVWK